MAYLDQIELAKRIPADIVGILANDMGDNEPVSKVVEEAILDAEGIIDDHLRGRYEVPLSAPIPQTVERIAVDLTSYFLYSRKYREEMPPAVTERYDRAMSMLRKIANGEMVLPSNTPTNFVGEVVTNKTASDRKFTKDILENY